jgi:hypothetical protein
VKFVIDEVSFQQRGTEVHMCKRLARNERAGVRDQATTLQTVFGSDVRVGRVSVSRYRHCSAAFGAASGSSDRRAWGSHRCGPEQDIPTSGSRGAVIGTSPEAKAFFFGGRELRSASYIPELTLDW